MVADTAYRKAEQLIEQARRDRATKLDLRNMGLPEVPEAIGQLTDLQKLDLSNDILDNRKEKNKISSLPEALGQLRQLQRLNLGGNKIGSLPEALGQLRQLQVLDLRGNTINSLPEAIGKLSQLQVLDLSCNTISNWPKAIGKLSQLQRLNLGRNKIGSLPEAIGKLSQLQVLDLSYNTISSLPEAIGKLSQLQRLNLGRNKIGSLPEALGQLSQLQVLYLEGNKIGSLPEALGQLSQLQRLYLEGNKIGSLPEALGQLSQLQRLNLGRNKIGSLPEALGQLSQLQQLDLSGNTISSLPEALGQLSQLQLLDLMGNKIGSLPETIGQLSQLQRLNLSGNTISSLPEAIGKLSHLQVLGLDDNPLNPQFAAAYGEGTQVLLQYLQSIAQDQVTSKEAKLILVGEGEVGKTSLLGALRGDKWEENRPTTHGIEIKPVTVKDPDSDTEIRLNGWDFGGQQVYRPTHQLFFSAPAVYLVVWKPREGPDRGSVEYWINLIKHRAPEAKILVVATHGGPKEREPDIDKHDIIHRFGRDTVLDFFHVDSKPDVTDNHIDDLKEAIFRVAADLPGVGDKVPAKWQQLRSDLQATGKAYLDYDEVIALCAEREMDESEANLFLRLSHTLGHIIHYHRDEMLKNIVILKPDWLAKAISFVLDDKKTREKQGLVEFSHLEWLWWGDNPKRDKTESYPPELHSKFRKLMERFDISYRVVEDPFTRELSDTSLIAQLVSDTRPEEKLEANWDQKLESDKEKQLICRIVDENGNAANAEGLFYQLIVRLHKYSLGREDYSKSTHWKRGLLLDDDYNGRALLEQVGTDGTDVRITVRAAYPEFWIYELTKEVTSLVEHFWRGLTCQVMVPCVAPCGKTQASTVLFEVERLIKFKNKGHEDYLCDLLKCDEWINIDSLLRNAPSPATQVTIDQTEEVSQKDPSEYNAADLATLSQVDLQFAQLKEAVGQAVKDGPYLFSFQPIEPGFFNYGKWARAKFQLTLWCEHSRQPLPALNPEDPTRGVYELVLPRKLLVEAKPLLEIVTKNLGVILPIIGHVIGSVTEKILDKTVYNDIKQELKLGTRTITDLAPEGKELPEGYSDASAEESYGPVRLFDGAILGKLHALLKEKDAENDLPFGGLERVQNKRREFCWVHPDFKDEEEYS